MISNKLRQAPADYFFEFSVQTDNAGTSTDFQFSVPTVATGSYDCTVFWGDGNSDAISSYSDAAWTHTYSATGAYTIRIAGTFSGIQFNNGGDCLKLTEISRWGQMTLGTTEGSYFYGCANLDVTAWDIPRLGSVTSLASAFRGCSSIASFNRVSDWDVSSVTDMSDMFNSATTFNQDISAWATASVTDMSGMFSGASAFDQDLGSMDVSAVTTMANMFNGLTLTTSNYDGILTGWEAQSVQSGVTLDAGSSTYTIMTSGTSRYNLMADSSWTITDGDSSYGTLSLWLDASDESTITSSAGKVSNWADKSGNGRDAVQATASAQPTTGSETENGLNVLTWDGSSDYMKFPQAAFPVANAHTVVIVLRKNAAGVKYIYLANGNDGTYTGRDNLGNFDTNKIFNVYGGSTLRGTTYSANTLIALTLQYDGTTRYLRQNNVLDASGTVTPDPLASMHWLGANKNGSRNLNGIVAEVFAFTESLGTSERASLQSDIASKWGI